MHWLELPGSLHVLSNPFIILLAMALYAVEFVADKIPVVDNFWDTAHTFIRPVAAGGMGLLAASHLGPVVQAAAGLVGGSIAASSHLTKATARVAVNTTTPSGTNAAVSLGEDGLVAVVLFFVIRHPVIASITVILLVAFSIWFLIKMFRFLKRVLFGKPSAKSAVIDV
jgi:hypothetical protein